jgi:hypothetical protein
LFNVKQIWKAVFDVLVSLFRTESSKTRAAPRPGRWQLFAFSEDDLRDAYTQEVKGVSRERARRCEVV